MGWIVLLLVVLGLVPCAQTSTCEIGKEKDGSNMWRWVLSHETPCDCQEIIMGGMNFLTPSRSFVPIYVDVAFLTDNVNRIRHHYSLDCTAMWGDWASWSECSTTCGNGTKTRVKTCLNSDFPDIPCEGQEPTESQICNHGQCYNTAGMQDGSITDEQIKASSYYSGYQGTYLPSYARLNNDSAWIADPDDLKPWIRVEFNATVNVIGIQTQGQTWNDFLLFGKDWVTTFQIKTRNTQKTIRYIKNSDNLPMTFTANYDASSIVTIMLPEPICSRFLRILPITWNSTYCGLRFEILVGSDTC